MPFCAELNEDMRKAYQKALPADDETRSFVLCDDSTGQHQRDDLFDTLLPMVPRLLAE